ncbi:hypothetical protein ACJX0J_011086 [Zea mays]
MKQGPNRDISLILEMVTLPRDDKTKSKTGEKDLPNCFSAEHQIYYLNNVFANVRSSPSSNGFILIPIFLEQTLGESRIKVVKLLRRLHGESTQDKAIWTINKKRFSVKSLYLKIEGLEMWLGVFSFLEWLFLGGLNLDREKKYSGGFLCKKFHVHDGQLSKSYHIQR